MRWFVRLGSSLFFLLLPTTSVFSSTPNPKPTPTAVAVPVQAQTPVTRRVLEVKNLGAAAVTLLLQRTDGGYGWGPYELAPHEELHIDYCPQSGLTLELRSSLREKPLRYSLTDLTSLLLSEDRWSEGEPIVVRAESAPVAACDGPAFRIKR
jgi:hypothetical protein